ncbi:Tctex1 domain-containing protein 2 [Galemys pyrenaicus]|uniref:Tctex1 domain-containing protein 2 n=1 Tax=Galemys pyrenaicus TaxID=202257 RepID=A0A8J5ZZG2_GALPY|nr:Tctex1 domain-containing protein 2 [Galemys pyrenaicus]
MASVGGTTFPAGASSVGEGVLEADTNAGDSENTYVLRPVFQQRRVVDGTWRGDPCNRFVGQAACLKTRGREGTPWGGAGRGGLGGGTRRARYSEELPGPVGGASRAVLASAAGGPGTRPAVCGAGALRAGAVGLMFQTVSFRFRPSVVKDCIHAVLKEELTNAEYSPEEMPQLTKRLSENIKDKLKEMGFDRYKMVVQVVIGEQRGEGVFMAARCFWDADTDNYTHDVFMNVSLFGNLFFFLSEDTEKLEPWGLRRKEPRPSALRISWYECLALCRTRGPAGRNGTYWSAGGANPGDQQKGSSRVNASDPFASEHTRQFIFAFHYEDESSSHTSAEDGDGDGPHRFPSKLRSSTRSRKLRGGGTTVSRGHGCQGEVAEG